MEDNGYVKVEWDRDKPWTGTTTLASGRTVRVDFDIDETELEAARKTLNFLIANEARIRHQIAVSLLKYVEDWIPDEISSPERLALRIDLTDILMWEGGGGQLYYYANGDDDLLTGHAVCAWFDADGRIEDEVGLDG